MLAPVVGWRHECLIQRCHIVCHGQKLHILFDGDPVAAGAGASAIAELGGWPSMAGMAPAGKECNT